MPFNFLWAGFVHVAFPRGTIIDCRRTAVDSALSMHVTHYHPSLVFPTRGAELVAYFRSYERPMDHWRSVLPANRFIEVDYEHLTSSTTGASEGRCGRDRKDALGPHVPKRNELSWSVVTIRTKACACYRTVTRAIINL